MNWFEPVDIYCERLAPGVLGEPLNLFTNFFFILAAVLAERRCRVILGRRTFGTTLLCALLTAVGIGSGLFHSFAVRWSELADEIPIALFVLTFLSLWIVRVFFGSTLSLRSVFAAGLGCLLTVLATATAVLVFGHLPLNGSQMYAGPFLALTVLGLHAARTRGRTTLFRAAAIFAVSLILRTLDRPLCDAIPVGMHFLWHIANSAVTYFVVCAYGEAVAADEMRRFQEG